MPLVIFQSVEMVIVDNFVQFYVCFLRRIVEWLTPLFWKLCPLIGPISAGMLEVLFWVRPESKTHPDDECPKLYFSFFSGAKDFRIFEVERGLSSTFAGLD